MYILYTKTNSKATATEPIFLHVIILINKNRNTLTIKVSRKDNRTLLSTPKQFPGMLTRNTKKDRISAANIHVSRLTVRQGEKASRRTLKTT